MNTAFAFLFRRSAANRVRAQIGRLRSPRYLAAFLAGGLYMWWFVFRPSAPSPRNAGALLGFSVSAIAPLMLVVVLGGVWLFGGDRSALAFTKAEISFLLPAPLSRRSLLAFKIVSAQMAIVFSSIIWVFLFRRGSPLVTMGLAAISFWVLFTTIAMHRLAAALVRASATEHGRAGARRQWVAYAPFLLVAVVLIAEVVRARPALAGAAGFVETLEVLGATMRQGGAQVVLAPFRAMLAPASAGSAMEWLRAMPWALLILVLHVVWLLRSDTAFEEAALEASVKRAAQLERLRARRSAMPVAPTQKASARTIALAPTGFPAVAIVWKNILCLMRTVHLRTLLGPIVVALAAAVAFSRRAGSPWGNVALVAVVFAMALLLFGGRTLRNDLRSDMLHLPILKTIPLRGSELVLAEIASGAVPMALVQLALFVLAGVSLAFDPGASPVRPDVRLGLLLAAPVSLLALNTATFTILNGTAVLFPAWMRLGTAAGGAGFELMGMSLLATTGLLLLLALLLIAPAIVVAVIVGVLRTHLVLAIAAGATIGGATLIGECWGASLLLGRAFERAEPTQQG